MIAIELEDTLQDLPQSQLDKSEVELCMSEICAVLSGVDELKEIVMAQEQSDIHKTKGIQSICSLITTKNYT